MLPLPFPLTMALHAAPSLIWLPTMSRPWRHALVWLIVAELHVARCLQIAVAVDRGAKPPCRSIVWLIVAFKFQYLETAEVAIVSPRMLQWNSCCCCQLPILHAVWLIVALPLPLPLTMVLHHLHALLIVAFDSIFSLAIRSATKMISFSFDGISGASS
jgi:hypothetical protein